ncbi:MAG: plasmid mobilization protein [Steroidobacteraceae bacterium]
MRELKLPSMSRNSRSEQLQIRVSAAEKEAIRRAAEHAGLDMSAYVLGRALPKPAMQLQGCIEDCAGPAAPSFALAELNTLLSRWTAAELRDAIATPPTAALTSFLANYIAAMIEQACERDSVRVPGWVRAIEPLVEPAFGSALQSLRLHLLTHSPPPFRRRNIFIDAALGDTV